MIKKVGIITMHKVLNFGSALQAYSLQTAIERLGFEVEIIDYNFPNDYQYIHRKRKSLWRKLTDGRLMYKISYRIALKTWLSWDKQRIKFFKFYSEFFKLTHNYNDYNELVNDPPIYDVICIGSDQVWNIKHTCGDLAFLGAFISNSIPRISYGSSFSQKQIDVNEYKAFIKELPQFKAISVRELSGVKIIKELSGKDACVVADPVFLLNKKDYETLSRHSSYRINEKYILAYILEYNFNPHPAIDRILKSIQKHTGYKVIYLLCGGIQTQKLKYSQIIADAGPEDFLSLIFNAEVVVTSSFHGAALSIIMNKNFYAFTDYRDNDDRLNSLLDRLNLGDRLLGNKADSKNFSFTAIDYDQIKNVVEEFRHKSLGYLRDALK